MLIPPTKVHKFPVLYGSRWAYILQSVRGSETPDHDPAQV